MSFRFLPAALGLALAGCSGTTVEAVNEQPPAEALWTDVTAQTIGETAEWSNKLEIADLNGDGWVDILFANGGNYESPGEPELSRIFLNQGPDKPFKEATEDIFGSEGMHVRVIKTADANADGKVDIFVGATYQAQSRLLLGSGDGKFKDVTASHLPSIKASIGDVEFGDADLDGDLDLVLADWGPGSPMKNEGGRAMLWLNDGGGKFSDATEEQMPETAVKFSWDLEFSDFDNDFDLDILVSSKMSDGSFVFENDGSGKFTDISAGAMPQFTNNYEAAPMDLDGDGYLDLVNINDAGLIEGTKGSRREHVFRNTGEGGFEVVTAEWLPDAENIGFDDNRTIHFDYDSDGDADVLLGSLSGPDRLLINDGKGHLTVKTDIMDGPETKGTLDIAAADLNGDRRIDLVQSQGEVKGHVSERVHFGAAVAPDSAAPKIGPIKFEDGVITARVHDNKTPLSAFDLSSVEVQAADRLVLMSWIGGYLWQAKAPRAEKVCATDAAGNSICKEISQ